MTLALQPLTSKEELNEFLARPELRRYATFFQSWEWGEFQVARGRKIHRFAIRNDAKLVATALLIEEIDRFGPFIYAPRGPVTDYSDQKQAGAVIKLLIEEGRKLNPKAICLRLDPSIVHDAKETKVFGANDFRPAAKFTQVERAWMADLQPTHEAQIEWQKEHGMRSNIPRYLRRAEREGVTVRSSDDPKDLEVFLKMITGLNERKNGIGLHPLDYYRQQFAALAPSGYERIFICEKDGEALSSAMITVFGSEASYLWGASTDQQRELRGPHFMHFQIMRYAQEHGCDRYNFWGVVKEENHHPGYRGYGFSEFKRSFGGYEELYLRTQDFVYRSLPYRLQAINDKRRLHSGQMD
jgi:lipid II:glycine glycyltransferase (peptidoglycan interpeptide bridge formation enzyme)